MIHAICSLSEVCPFLATAEERRESGNTVNRSLGDTRRAIDAWHARNHAPTVARSQPRI